MLEIEGDNANLNIVSGNFYFFGGVGGSITQGAGELLRTQAQYDRIIREIYGDYYNAAAYKKW